VKRIVRIASGFVLLVVGTLLIVLPGPGWLTIALGLALLAPDFPWAKSALDTVKDASEKGASAARQLLRRFWHRSSRAN
jgi:uncharacterized protein (TIGR02611 family)